MINDQKSGKQCRKEAWKNFFSKVFLEKRRKKRVCENSLNMQRPAAERKAACHPVSPQRKNKNGGLRCSEAHSR